MKITIPSKEPEVHYRKLSDLKGDGKFCCDKAPLLQIELDHIIPDELHLMLRVTDVLIDALMSTVTSFDLYQHHRDQMQHAGRRCRALDILEGPMLKKLIAAINSCGVSFHVWKDDKTLKWPSIMGPQKLKLLERLPAKLTSCHPVEMVPDVQTLWKDFNGIYNNMSSCSPSNCHKLQEMGKKWVNAFLKLGQYPYSDGYQPDKITPYMHIMVYHMPTFIAKYKRIKQFSCQGIEKNNDMAKKVFFRSSNKWDAAKDMLAKLFQQSLLRSCKRKTRDYEKQNDSYWFEGGIEESRSKRPRISHTTNC